jgi:hypothetical protein
MNDDTDLSDIPTDDLLVELLERHHHAGFIGGNYDEQEASVIRRRWKGNCHTIVGLLFDLSAEVIDEYRRDTKSL